MEWKRKKESKWLIVENRKVHCYLCGRKMLKASQRIYDAESGHYSHAICEKEKQLTGTNERRSAVKKIVAGAGVLGLTAVGVDKFTNFGRMSNSVFSSNAKDQTANPELETVITSQGIILPSLKSDPANPVAGQMWYRSDAGVTAHFDSIQNRVVYSSEINNGNVNVTSKGIVNGLSVLPNDGTGGFGPDTTSGATSVGEIGSPYTQTCGIMEAIEALPVIYSPTAQQNIHIGHIKFVSIGNYVCTSPIYYTDGDMIWFEGNGGNVSAESSDQDFAPPPAIVSSSNTDGAIVVLQSTGTQSSQGYGGGINHWSNMSIIHTEPITVIDKLANADNSASFSAYCTPSKNIFENVTIWDQSYSNTVLELYTDTSDDVMILNNVFVFGSTWTAKATAKLSANYFNTIALLSSNHLTSTYFLIYSRNGQPTSGIGFGGIQGTLLDAKLDEDSNFDNLMLIGTPNGWFMFTAVGTTNNASVTIGSLALEYDGDFPPPDYGIDAEGNYWMAAVLNDMPLKILSMSNNSFNGVSLLPAGSYYTSNPANLIFPKGFSFMPTPTISANPPVSGTVYQNTNPYDIEIDLPVYATTAGTAGYVTVAKGTTDTPTAIGNQYVSGDTSSTATQIIRLRVPAGWYYSFTGSGVTFGTATPFAE